MPKSDGKSSSINTNKNDSLKQTTMGNFFSGSKPAKKPSMKKKKSVLDDESSYFTSYRRNDLEQYRLGYPGKKDNKKLQDNMKFYKNEMKSYPDGDFIDNIHKNWWGDYERLERHHGYVQWLFPIRETGMNFHAQELQMFEIEKIMDDPKAFARVLKSYEMMLDFYGMKLDEKTGQVSRAKNWKARFSHLNRSYHNYLRITRILKFLGEFGYEHYKRPFVEFTLQEAMEHETLENTLESCVRYWLETIKSEEDREQLKDYIRKMEAGYNSPDDETNGKELVSSAKVDKMVEKSLENQKEVEKRKLEDESGEDIDEASNEEWKKKEEKMKRNSQKEEKERLGIDSEETKGKEGTGAEMSDKEKGDVAALLKAEEKMMEGKKDPKNETDMETDNVDDQGSKMDTS
ncbi:opioid growth factor receptor-like protein 1 [Saccostrea echinata]|uniref:opioid growth factor receptor-like protein 1 n=1 Tax=Saccostrea echinata TaxID=191078 RepID=UPI002A83CD3C|nr:opioid growth factor receptor-like protein 1 [Saccostrea echinata]